MLAEQFRNRHGNTLMLVDCLLEGRCFSDRKTNPQADDDQDDRGDEWNAPAPAQKRVLRDDLQQQPEDAGGEEKADGCAELREHAVPAPLAFRRILGCEENSATPFAAEAEALAEPAQCEQQRRHDADRSVGGQQADNDRRNTHGQEGGDQRRLATDLVAEMTEDNGAEWTGEEGDREGGKGSEKGGGRIVVGEEQRREDQDGCRRIDIKIKEFDRGADKARDQNARRGIDLRTVR